MKLLSKIKRLIIGTSRGIAMQNFDFYNPTRIYFGKNKINKIQTAVPAEANVLITYGGGSAVRNGLIAAVRQLLEGRKVYEFGGIEPNPRYETLMKAVDMVRQHKIDFILAVGGGSVIDGTKFISMVSNYSGDARDFLRLNPAKSSPKVTYPVVPFGTVLTLPATGSEMNMGAVISYEHGKYPVMNELNYPRFSILDPTYTYTLPEIQVANGIADTFVHTTEQYLTYPVDARLQDRISEGILLSLIEIGEKAISEPQNYDVRANLVWCSTMALNGIIGAGVPQDWATHMIGHEITAMFGIDHGQTLAIILPALLEIRKKQKWAKLLQYAERVWNLHDGTEEERIDKAIEKTRSFFRSLGIRTQLSEYGIRHEDLKRLADKLQEHGHTRLSETQDITPEISLKILERAF